MFINNYYRYRSLNIDILLDKQLNQDEKSHLNSLSAPKTTLKSMNIARNHHHVAT